MAAPVQIVLDAGGFVKDFTKPGGGGQKDFYSGRDDEFREHRDRLVRQVRSLALSKTAFQRSSVAVASVELIPDALAKSNRPKSLWPTEALSHLGTGKPAELLMQVTSGALVKLADRIESAPTELQTYEKINKRTGEVTLEKRVPALRSEVGAIEGITFWTPDRKLPISLEEMLAWFIRPGTALGLVVRLFIFTGQEALRFANEEMGALQSDLESLGCKVALEAEKDDPFQQQILLIRTVNAQDIEAWLTALPKILERLSRSLVVRTVHVPALVQSTSSTRTAQTSHAVSIPARKKEAHYPVVGVIDGGIADCLTNWVEVGSQFVRASDGDPGHGTEIAGLLILGQGLNNTPICPEPDGCLVIDMCLVPREEKGGEDLFRRYYGDTSTFFGKLEDAVIKAKAEHGARVFNFSLNLSLPPSSSSDYCYETQCLDRIAWKHDVVFVISAGNLPRGGNRPEWPQDDIKALGIFALAGYNDGICAPADSVANVSVTAVNPPDVAGYIPEVLAAYARRGPSPFGGLKPDLAHYGGCADSSNSGLLSVSHNGHSKCVNGTSYAAPLVAKTLARYRQLIDGDVSRELLIALLIHHSRVPEPFERSPISDIAKDLVGFGMPLPASVALEGRDASVTLVFESEIPKGKRLEFGFAWPRSLTDNGKCRGRGRLTLVSMPRVRGSDGDEFARTQLDAHLNQLDPNGKAKGGAFSSIGLPESIKGKDKIKEASLRRHQLKWSAVKVYEFESPRGVGETSQWRLMIESLERADGDTPKEGIRFVAILTIEDMDGAAPVFNELRQQLTSQDVKLADLRIATRARAGRGKPS